MKQFPEKMVKITARNLRNNGGDDREGGGRDLSIKRQNPGVAIIISQHKFPISQFEDHNNSGGVVCGVCGKIALEIVRTLAFAQNYDLLTFQDGWSKEAL